MPPPLPLNNHLLRSVAIPLCSHRVHTAEQQTSWPERRHVQVSKRGSSAWAYYYYSGRRFGYRLWWIALRRLITFVPHAMRRWGRRGLSVIAVSRKEDEKQFDAVLLRGITLCSGGGYWASLELVDFWSLLFLFGGEGVRRIWYEMWQFNSMSDRLATTQLLCDL